MNIAAKKWSRFLLVLGLVAFLAVLLSGPSHSMGMEKQSDGTMSGCLFIGMDELCAMTSAEHLAAWQSMFAATAPQKALVFSLLILFALIFVFVLVHTRRLFLPWSDYIIHFRLYIRHNPHLSLFDPLKEAFSQGLLNPKIY